MNLVTLARGYLRTVTILPPSSRGKVRGCSKWSFYDEVTNISSRISARYPSTTIIYVYTAKPRCHRALVTTTCNDKLTTNTEIFGACARLSHICNCMVYTHCTLQTMSQIIIKSLQQCHILHLQKREIGLYVHKKCLIGRGGGGVL